MLSRLKSLELQGYKTFASKINFEFPAKITAVVGPNGSGKSNIADSIRWVLGEQSFRLLRGRKTEDMIFAGSEFRSRAGMASATITFDNEDGWLPIDFSEVSVTRRAYRDGQNEYLLNGQKIRLRDIQELLSQSGLAERTYTLIGQGLVDSALSIRPEERRKFFEEAAGIGLYRSRREEALNRLDTTRRNLERVKDILSELEPRLRSLERQARRFLEYKTIQADLQVLLRDWYGYHWHRAQNDVMQSKQVLREREVRQENARDTFERYDRRISTLRTELQELRTLLNNWHVESSGLHRQREQISRDLAVLDERQRSMTDQKRNFGSDLTRLDEEIKSRKLNLESLGKDYALLRQEYQDAQTQMQQAQKVLETRRMERESVERESREQRRLLVQQETTAVELKARQNELDERLNNLVQTREKTEKDIVIARRSQVEKKQHYDSLVLSLSSGEEERKKLEADITVIANQMRELDEKVRVVQKETNRLQGEQARLNAQLDVLEQAERSLNGLNQGSKSLMEAVQKGGFSGKYSTLSSLLEAGKEYELAIAASLGEFLDAVVLEDADPEDAMHLLAKTDKGRAILLPVSLLREVNLNPTQKDSGIIGRITDFIKVKSAYQPLINALLGNTFLVADRSEAKKIIQNAPVSTRLVTLEGEIFDGIGSIVAGKENRTSVIARPRQKRELQEMLLQIQTSVLQIQEDGQGFERQFEQLKAAQTQTRKLLAQSNESQQNQQKLVHQANLVFEQAKQRLDWMDNQIQSLEQQITQTETTRKETQKAIHVAEEKAENYRVVVRGIAKRLDGMSLEEAQSVVGHWKTNAAVSERAANEAKKRLDENEQLVNQNNQRLIALKRRMEDISMTQADLDDEKGVLRAKEQELQIQIEAVQQKINPAENQLRTIEQSYTKLQEEQSTAQQAVSIAERHVAQGQLEFSRFKDTLANLSRRIEEDFGLVAFEYSNTMSGPTPLPLDGLVEQLPKIETLEPALEENINRQRAQLRRIGPINPDADEEYVSVKERFEFMSTQVEDLKKADEDLRQVINELDELMQREFRKTFDAVASVFKELFTRLFGGGSAKLLLTDEENFNNTGIDIEARLPGRREQGLSLLSGGERSLTAVALIFAL
ncbi:MAG: chromosome segregation protein SMC [Chloroflexi bacterium HGW-Chloroflexi-10]|nr:MAG: chromosome segregation protein SMC [Chloroflexi bacterium HGW-Chloroflexi-10]